MDVDGIANKLVSKADTIGTLLGGYGTLGAYGREWGKSPLNAGWAIIDMIIKNPHIPNIEHVMQRLTDQTPVGQAFMGSAKGAVYGWVLSELGIHPSITKVGHFLKTAGINGAKASAIITLLAYSGAGNSPWDPRTYQAGSSGSGFGSAW